MKNKSQYRITAVAMIISMVILALLALGASGKVKLSYTAEVTVKNGAVEGEGRQAIYLKSPGETCSFSVSAKTDSTLKSEVTFYKNASLTDAYTTVQATADKSVTENVNVMGDSLFVTVQQSLAEGGKLPDGVYTVDYDIKVAGNKGVGRILLMVLLMIVVLVLFLVILSSEEDKERQVSKKQIRLRRKAYMNAFYTLVMLVLSFTLLSASVEQFPFTMYQSGIISIITAATVFFMTADSTDAYPGIRRKRGSLIMIFGIVAAVNLFVAIFQLFLNKSSDITPTGNGVLGDWIVNLVIALCFFAMTMEMLMKNAREDGRAAAGRSRRYAQKEDEDYESVPVRRPRKAKPIEEEYGYDEDVDL